MPSLYDEYRQFEFDRFNALKSGNETITPKTADDMFGTLVEAYINGFRSAAYILGISEFPISPARAAEVIMSPVGGETFEERLAKYDGNTFDDFLGDIERILVTEIHRAFLQGQFDAAVEAGAKTKTWDATMDNVTRQTHEDLHGTEIPIDEYFETVNGMALAPGLFDIGEEDCNCRCILSFSF